MWKTAFITHVYKNKGTSGDVNNCMPTSVRSVVYMLLEKNVKHLHSFVIEKNTLYKFQSGFQSTNP